MIAILQGDVLEAGPVSAVISVGGVGYDVRIPVTTAEKLPPIGKQVRLYTHVVYREDEQTLYGFWTREERDFFRLLIEKVSGVGPKIALSLMSKLSILMLQSAISSGDVALLSKTPGIGKKSAERIVVELRDKVLPSGSGASVTSADAPKATEVRQEESRIQDAVAALMTLGYKLQDADKAVQKAVAACPPDASTQDLIRKALAG